MSPEVEQMTVAEMAAERLIVSLQDQLAQGILFEDGSLGAELRDALRQRNPGKIIVGAALLEEYRYRAACLGAGFDLDDPRLESGANKMWDEVANDIFNIFTKIVEDVEYEPVVNSYVTNEYQLRKLFAYDFENLKGLSEAGFILLYEDYEEDDVELDPADFLEAALMAWKPGALSAESLVYSAASMAGRTEPNAGKHLLTVAQDLIDNDPRLAAGSGAEAIQA